MRSEFYEGARPTGRADSGGGDLRPLLQVQGYRVSDERYQATIIGGLMRSLIRQAGKALHAEPPRRPTHA